MFQAVNFWIKLTIATIIFASIPFKATADTAKLRMGFGISNTEKSAIYSASWEERFGISGVYKVDAGAWTDVVEGRRASPYGAVLVGLQQGDLRTFNVQILVGVSVIGHIDSFLGSNGQFTEELNFGIGPVSVGYKHVSNAGIVQPNMGRDFVSTMLAFEF